MDMGLGYIIKAADFPDTHGARAPRGRKNCRIFLKKGRFLFMARACG
jgi:hypothetical protein